MLSWRFYSSFQIQWQRWHLKTFRKSNRSRLFRASQLGQMNLLHQQIYATSRCFELREIHSVSSTLQNDVVMRNNVFPWQAPNQLKISFLENILFSVRSLNYSLTLHFKFQKPISLFSLIDKHIQSMETSSEISIGTCLKEHQKIYKEWFNVADSGFSVFLPPPFL